MKTVIFACVFSAFLLTFPACVAEAEGATLSESPSEINHNGPEQTVRFSGAMLKSTRPLRLDPWLPSMDAFGIWHFGHPENQVAAILDGTLPDGCTLTRVKARVDRHAVTTSNMQMLVYHAGQSLNVAQAQTGYAPNIGPEDMTFVGNRLFVHVDNLIVYIYGNGPDHTLHWIDVTFTCPEYDSPE